MTVADAPWESKVLGVKSGVLTAAADEIEAAVAQSDAEGFEFVTAKVPTTDYAMIHALERNGFLLIETVLHYSYRYSDNVLPPAPDVAIRRAEDSDTEALVKLAALSFGAHFGRFHSDPRIGHERANRVYEEWMRSAMGGYADDVFVAECDGRIAAVSIWRTDGDLAHYSLGAVHPDHFSRGLFKAVTIAGMRRYAGMATELGCATNLHNLPVQAAFQTLGWRRLESKYTFHRWSGR